MTAMSFVFPSNLHKLRHMHGATEVTLAAQILRMTSPIGPNSVGVLPPFVPKSAKCCVYSFSICKH